MSSDLLAFTMFSEIFEVAVGVMAGFGVYLLYFPPRKKTVKRRPWRKWWTQRASDFSDFSAGAGRRVHLEMFLALSVASGLIAGLVAATLTQLPLVGVLAGLFSAYLPYLVMSSNAHRLQSKRAKAWPHLVDNLVSGVRAGLSLGETLLAVADAPPASLQGPFAHFAAEYRAAGNLDASLAGLKRELASPVADRIIEALRLAAQVGGNDLVALLEDLGAMLRAEERTRGEVLARQSWTVTGARMAAAAPWIILALLLARGQTIAVYSTPTGSFILLVGASVSVVAYLLMLRVGRLDAIPRTMRE